MTATPRWFFPENVGRCVYCTFRQLDNYLLVLIINNLDINKVKLTSYALKIGIPRRCCGLHL